MTLGFFKRAPVAVTVYGVTAIRAHDDELAAAALLNEAAYEQAKVTVAGITTRIYNRQPGLNRTNKLFLSGLDHALCVRYLLKQLGFKASTLNDQYWHEATYILDINW